MYVYVVFNYVLLFRITSTSFITRVHIKLQRHTKQTNHKFTWRFKMLM